MSEPVASEAPPAKRSLLVILLGVVTSRDFALRLMIGAVGAAALGWLGPQWAFAGIVLSQLLADTIKEFVTSREWSVRRLWFVTALALLFDRIRHRLSRAGSTPVATPLVSTLAATVVVVGAFTAVDAARGQSLVGHRHTTFFGGGRHTTAPSVRLPDGRVVTRSAQLAFHDVRVGSSSKPDSLVVSSGSRELRQLRIDASPAAFHVENGCAHRLPAHSSCRVGIVFQPDHAGQVGGRLTIAFVEDPELTLTLEGTAVQAVGATLAPRSLSFERTRIGSQAPAQAITVHSGNAPLPIAKIATGSKEFTVAGGDCPQRLPERSMCTIRLAFAPVAAGARKATLTVTRSGGGRPLKAALTGTAGSPPAQAALTPDQGNFGNVDIGTRSTVADFTLTAGSSALPIGRISATSKDYRITANDCPVRVDAGHSCTIGVTFLPSAEGDRRASLVVRRSDGGGQLSATLRGVGISIAPTLKPPKSDFGSVDVGRKSAPTDFTLSAGSSAFPYKGATTRSKDFRITANNCSGTLDPLSSCTITVVFGPVESGDRSDTLTVTRTDGGTPLTATLSGVGLAPNVVLSPTSLDFGKVCIDCGGPPPTQRVTLSNNGNATLTIRSITSSNPKRFTVANDCGQTLAPGDACSFSVTFVGLSGSSQASIDIDADGSGQHSLAVTATGYTG
jgi:hypothetical protein